LKYIFFTSENPLLIYFALRESEAQESESQKKRRIGSIKTSRSVKVVSDEEKAYDEVIKHLVCSS
jgi:hypothetical protein